MANLIELVDGLTNKLRKDTFDPAAVVESVGDDPRALLKWTSDNTFWVPYRGALRGPQGVLLDGFGSHLDRSLLLAELLTRAGHTVRLVRKTLSNPEAARLIQGLAPIVDRNAKPQATEMSQEEEEQEYKRFAEATGQDAAVLKEAVRAVTQREATLALTVRNQTTEQARFLLSTVGKPSGTDEQSTKALAAMADYWWVQTEDGPHWIDLDPMNLGADSRTVKGTPDQTFPYQSMNGTLELPEAFVHGVTIRVLIDQMNSGTSSTHKVFEQAVRPAEVMGQSLTLQIVPVGWPQDGLPLDNPIAALKARAMDQREWQPVLTIGNRSVKQVGFSDRGDIVEKPGQGHDAIEEAFGGFGGGDQDKPKEGELTGVSIEYEVRVPGEPGAKVTRQIYRLDRGANPHSPEAKAVTDTERLRRSLNLLTTVQLLLSNARPSPEYLAYLSAKHLSTNRNEFASWVAGVSSRDLGKAIDASTKVTASSERLLALAALRFKWSPSGQDVFVASPNILSYRTNIIMPASETFSVQTGLDIVTNSVGVHLRSSTSTFDARLMQGVADTSVEAALGPNDGLNASRALASALKEGRPWATLRSVQNPAPQSWPAQARTMIDESVRAGLVVLLPSSVAGSSSPAPEVWWRINPRTGETLGMGQFGGQTQVERVLIFLAFGLVTYIVVDAICVANKGGSEQIKAEDVAKCTCAGMAGGAGVGGYAATFTYMPKNPPGFLVGLGFVITAAVVGAFCAL